jgi:XTP/dITP diphosphohydrolase
MIKILIATGNMHKVKELSEILPHDTENSGAVAYYSFADFPKIIPPEENGATFEENAIIKARAGLLGSGLISIADDTGLMVDALGGAPGVCSGRYAFPGRSDYHANNEKLLTELKDVPFEKRTARFVTVAAMVLPNGQTLTARGTVEGRIAFEYSGASGFGYDPLFIVDSLGVSMADLTMNEKNEISHRGQAFTQMADIIRSL